MPVRPDAVVFLAPVEAHPGLRPFPGEAEILSAVRWSDADHDAVRRAGRRIRGAIPEARRGLKAVGAGKSAVRAQHPAGAVPDHPALASGVRWGCREARLRPPVFAAAELCTQAADRFAE